MPERNLCFETRAIHEGQRPDRQTGAVITPIYQSSTYEQDAIGQPRGYEYSRTGNPTRSALEQALASLEGGRFGLAFASGSAASVAVLQLLQPGDHIIAGADLYGGTYRLFERVYRPWGVEISYVDGPGAEAFEAAVCDRTKMIWVESPTNPLLKLFDLEALAAMAARREMLLTVDNTFASPYFQRPLELGAALVLHSTTKYLGGHSDVIGGAVVTSDQSLFERLKFYQNAAGAVPGVMDCWLVLRGLKTLGLRMKQHDANGGRIAELLSQHPRVARVYYPGLPEHPQHELAKRQMSGFGGMVSFDLKGGYAAVERFAAELRLFILAESLGGVESLLCYPAKMTHASIDPEERRRRGIGDSLLRLSVGIEHIDDLCEDLKTALDRSAD